MTKREYAASLGLAIAGARGRMSREAHAAILKAEGEGMVFSDPSPVTVAVKAPKEKKNKAPKEKRETPEGGDGAGVMADTFYRHPLGTMFKGFDSNGKQHIVSGANACQCGYSLVGHTCNFPTALIGSPLEHINVVPV